MRTVPPPALLLLLLCAAAAGYEELHWSADCAGGHDRCAALEFCRGSGAAFGYRQAGGACISPGPLIRMAPGTKYLLTVRNGVAGTVTNVHTHGLHVSGSGNGDNIVREASHEECLAYSWDIPAAHVGGLSWYHAHAHHYVEAQLAGGAYGQVIIEDTPQALLPHSLSAAERDNVAAWLANDLTVMVAKDTRGWVVDGAARKTFVIIKDEWYRLRVGFSDAGGKGKELSFPAGCFAAEFAYDGVPRSPAPSEQVAKLQFITGASRVEYAFRCTALGEHTISVSQGVEIAFTTISGSPTAATPYTAAGGAWAPVLPCYLAGCSAAPETSPYEIRMGATSINGEKWNADAPAWSMPLGAVGVWTVKSSAAHPFHVHVNHVRIVRNCAPHQDGQYYDTVSTSGACEVRFAAEDFVGRTVLHCHNSAHSDLGAMAWMNVTGDGEISVSDPAVEPYQCAASALGLVNYSAVLAVAGASSSLAYDHSADAPVDSPSVPVVAVVAFAVVALCAVAGVALAAWSWRRDDMEEIS